MNVKSLVLVVDDDEIIRTFVRALLEEAGFEVVDAANGGEALSQARRSDPDVILMDLDMPTLSGWDATAFLRSLNLTSDTPIIAVTSRDLSVEGPRLKDLGFSGHVAKPQIPEKLVGAVRSVLRSVEDGSDWVDFDG